MEMMKSEVFVDEEPDLDYDVLIHDPCEEADCISGNVKEALWSAEVYFGKEERELVSEVNCCRPDPLLQ